MLEYGVDAVKVGMQQRLESLVRCEEQIVEGCKGVSGGGGGGGSPKLHLLEHPPGLRWPEAPPGRFRGSATDEVETL